MAYDPNEESYSYRLWSADGTLLYVGITSDVYNRIRSHERSISAEWFNEVARASVRRHPNRDEAAKAEHKDYWTHRPKGNGRPPERVARKSYTPKRLPKIVFPAAAEQVV